MKNVHLIAACGVGMASLAGMFKEKGFRVTGSDANIYPPMSDQLARLGIPLASPYAAENIPADADFVVVGNAVSRDNPECLEAVRRNLPLVSMPQAVARYFIEGRDSIVVAGTHGKTTTTALLSWALYHLGADPSFLVGGVPRNFPVSYRLGGGPHFVIEGDEYDTAWFDKGPKFLHYLPKIVLLTSIEFDHADIYRDLTHLKESFRNLVRLIPAKGLLVACADYADVVEIARQAPCPVVFYGNGGAAGEEEGAGPGGFPFAGERGGPTGFAGGGRKVSFGGGPAKAPCPQGAGQTRAPQPKGEDLAAWRVAEGTGDLAAPGFRMERGAKRLVFHFPLAGRHNAQNAAAAAIVLLHLGFEPSHIDAAFARFEGIRRRQEVVGEFGGILLIDDFAHHPTAVRETIRAIRGRYPGRPVIAVFEPRSNTSRRKIFQEEFTRALAEADAAILAGVFGADRIPPTERLNPAAVVAGIRRLGRDAEYIEEVDRIVERLAARARSGDLILVMSNGGFGGMQKKLAKALSDGKTAR